MEVFNVSATSFLVTFAVTLRHYVYPLATASVSKNDKKAPLELLIQEFSSDHPNNFFCSSLNVTDMLDAPEIPLIMPIHSALLFKK